VGPRGKRGLPRRPSTSGVPKTGFNPLRQACAAMRSFIPCLGSPNAVSPLCRQSTLYPPSFARPKHTAIALLSLVLSLLTFNPPFYQPPGIDHYLKDRRLPFLRSEIGPYQLARQNRSNAVISLDDFLDARPKYTRHVWSLLFILIAGN
jgi:hypothetical protein